MSDTAHIFYSRKHAIDDERDDLGDGARIQFDLGDYVLEARVEETLGRGKVLNIRSTSMGRYSMAIMPSSSNVIQIVPVEDAS
jgi:hypothetical protein